MVRREEMPELLDAVDKARRMTVVEDRRERG
jgi:hypothetical protein